MLVEVGLIDGGTGEAVLDVDVDVLLTQREVGGLAVGIDHDKGAARVRAGGHERRLGRHHVTHPVHQVEAGRDGGFLVARVPLLARGQRFRQALHLDFSLQDADASAGLGRPYRHFRGLREDLLFPGVNREGTPVGDCGHLNVDPPHLDRKLPTGVERHLGVLIQIDDRPVRHNDGAALPRLGLEGLANLEARRGSSRRSGPTGQPVFRAASGCQQDEGEGHEHQAAWSGS